jgi:hypothetical protein
VKHVEFLNESWLSRRHHRELIVCGRIPGAVVPLYFFKIVLNILDSGRRLSDIFDDHVFCYASSQPSARKF